MQEWKASRGQMGFLSPKFQPNADLSDQLAPRAPALKLCRMTANGHLEIPRDVRDKWLADPVRRNLSSMIFNVVFNSHITMWYRVIVCVLYVVFWVTILVLSKILIGVCVFRTLTVCSCPALVMLLLHHNRLLLM